MAYGDTLFLNQQGVTSPDQDQATLEGYEWLENLAKTDPSIADLLARAETAIETMDPTEFSQWMSQEYSKTQYAIDNYASKENVAVIKNDPLKRGEYERLVSTKRDEIADSARVYGVVLDEATLNSLAEQATDNAWSDLEVRNQLRPLADQQVAAGQDLMGNAGDYQRELTEWLNRNGVKMSAQAISKYVGRMTFEEQSLEDVKQEVREDYMAGMFPAWSDRIMSGFDVTDVIAPYRSSAAALLEIGEDDLAINDPLLSQGMQALDSDGKPRMMPLYEFEQLVRKDSRWQTTDNAYETYTNVGQDLLRMFGFR
jgi:hypothetical protein